MGRSMSRATHQPCFLREVQNLAYIFADRNDSLVVCEIGRRAYWVITQLSSESKGWKPLSKQIWDWYKIRLMSYGRSGNRIIG